MAGNVGPDVITTLPIGVASIDAVTNPRAATGGADEESIDKLRARASQVLRGGGRAVTADNYKQIALEETGVGKATVLPLSHPSYPGYPLPGCVTVVVVPDQVPPPNPGDPQPQPPQEMLDRVSARLQTVRALGTELFVTGPRYKRIVVNASVLPADNVSDAQAMNGAQKAIQDYLAPVRRPPTVLPKTPPPAYPLGWPFDETFYPSRLFDQILNATDESGMLRLVKSVSSLTLEVAGKPATAGDSVTFEADQLPAATAQVTVPLTRRIGSHG